MKRFLAVCLSILTICALLVPAFAETAPQDMTAVERAISFDGGGEGVTAEEIANLYVLDEYENQYARMEQMVNAEAVPENLLAFCSPAEGKLVLLRKNGIPETVYDMLRGADGRWFVLGSSDADDYLEQAAFYTEKTGSAVTAVFLNRRGGTRLGYLFDDTVSRGKMLGYHSYTLIDSKKVACQYYEQWRAYLKGESIHRNPSLMLLDQISREEAAARQAQNRLVMVMTIGMFALLFGCIAWALVRAWKQKGTEREKWMDKVPLAHLLVRRQYFRR